MQVYYQNHSTDCQMILSINPEQLVHWGEQLVLQDTKRGLLGPATPYLVVFCRTVWAQLRKSAC